jgi:hypothetical protein
MHLINITTTFKTEDACLDHLVKMRWPNGVCCIKCGGMEVSEMRIAASHRKNGKYIPPRRLFRCMNEGASCYNYQFSPKAGTIFDKSHLPLTKWFMVIGLITAAKKGMSALQVARHLNMEGSYKTVWYLCHRVREAMQEVGLLHGVVEADEMFLNPRKPRKGNPKVKNPNRMAVLGMAQRGGNLKLIPIKDAKLESIKKPLLENVHRSALLQTDTSFAHGGIGRVFFPHRHRMINHIVSYVEGDNHTQGVENAFSLLKRGIYGTFHQVSEKHLARYCNEFSYRFNRRHSQKEMFDATVKELAHGKALRFKTLIASEEANPSDVSR